MESPQRPAGRSGVDWRHEGQRGFVEWLLLHATVATATGVLLGHLALRLRDAFAAIEGALGAAGS